MSNPRLNGAHQRFSSFDRASKSPPPMTQARHDRSRSYVGPSGDFPSRPATHSRNQSFSPMSTDTMTNRPELHRSGSVRTGTPMSATFAPQFIKSGDMERHVGTSGIMEGENDLSGKRYVWMRDSEKTFVRGWVVQEQDNSMLLVQCEDNTVYPEYITKALLRTLMLHQATKRGCIGCRQSQPSQIWQSQ